MDYMKEALAGAEICEKNLNELKVLDMIQMYKDWKSDDPIRGMMRVFYAGYSIGYRDATELHDTKQAGDDPSRSEDVTIVSD